MAQLDATQTNIVRYLLNWGSIIQHCGGPRVPQALVSQVTSQMAGGTLLISQTLQFLPGILIKINTIMSPMPSVDRNPLPSQSPGNFNAAAGI